MNATRILCSHIILTNTNNAPPEVGAVEVLYAVPKNSFTRHLILLLISNKKRRSDLAY